LLILAALGLKTRVLYRGVTTNLLVDSLTFALRNPERTFSYDKPALVVIFSDSENRFRFIRPSYGPHGGHHCTPDQTSTKFCSSPINPSVQYIR